MKKTAQPAYLTKEDFQIILSVVLRKFGNELRDEFRSELYGEFYQKIKEEIDKSGKKYKNELKNELSTQLDDIVKQLEITREDRDLAVYQTRELKEEVDDHEKRLRSLENIKH